MTDNLNANTIGNIIRGLGMVLNAGVYFLLEQMYQVFFNVASAQLFENETIKNFYGRIQLIIGVFMVFKLTITILQGIMDPDKFMNPKEGFGNFITRVVVALALLTTLMPINIPNAASANSFEKYLNNNGLLFGVLYSLQDRILSNNTLGRLILGTTDNATGVSESNDATTTAQKLDQSSRIFASTVLKSFYRINMKPAEGRTNDDETDRDNWYCNHDMDKDDRKAVLIYQQLDVSTSTLLSSEMVEASCKLEGDSGSWMEIIPVVGGFFKTGRYVFAFNWIVSFIVGIVFLVVLVGFTIDIAIRAIKLAVLRLLAPIPVISYIEPKSAKDGMFASWVKSLTSTYLDLFLRLAIVYFVIFLIQDMIVNGIVIGDAGGFVGPVSFVFIMLGLFFFAKMAPKFIKDALGIKGMGMSNVGLSGILAGAGAIRQGGTPLDMVWAAKDASNAQVQAFNQGKAAPGLGMAFNSGRDLAAQMITGDDRMTHQKMSRGKWQLREVGITPEAADKIHSKAIEASNFTERMSSDAMNHRFTYMDESGAMQNYKYEYTDPTTGAKSLRNVTNDEEMSLALSQQKALSGKLNARDKKVDAELKRTGQSRSYRDTTRIPNDKDTSPFNQAITDKYLAYRQSRRYSKEKGPDTYKDPLAPNKYATGYDIKTHY